MYLITGASGHIGNTLIRTLLSENPDTQIRALVLPDDSAPALKGLAVEIVRGNVLDSDSLDRAMVGVEAVIHLAAIIAIHSIKRELIENVNIQGAVNVAEAALRARVRRLVHVASVHVFERVPTGVLDETIPLVTEDRAAGLYDYTKAEAVRRVRTVIDRGLDVVFACPTGVFGPNDYQGSEFGAVIRRYGSSRAATQYTLAGGYDYVDVRDVAAGLLALAEKGTTGDLYLLSGNYCSNADMVSLIGDIQDRELTVRIVPFMPIWALAHLLDVLSRVFRFKTVLTPYSLRTIRDNANFTHQKATDAIGWKPRPFKSTLADALVWYEAHGKLAK